MKNNSQKILEEFDNCQNRLNEFGESVNQLIKSLLASYEIKPHQLTFRIKQKSSLDKKLVKKNFKYTSLNEVTDLIGFRVITYFEDEIDKIAELITKEFTIDPTNSIDKRQLEADKFGYRSLHFVISLKPDRLKLTEYKNFNGLTAEIQIRSILQHSWAEIEHDLGYKGESEIPENAKRTFYRVAALLEQADIEFVKLKSLINEHQNNVKKRIQAAPSSVTIDRTSLLSYIESSATLKKTELALQNNSFEISKNEDPNFIISNAMPRLKGLDVNSIKDLDDLFKKNIDKITEHVKNSIPGYDNKENKVALTFVPGASILWLCGVLEKNKKKQAPN